ncbi:MAG TPA: DUF445 domain-containing protein [Candidatus Nanopelagicales bacterium]
MAASFVLSPDDLERRTRLRQAKTVASGLLVLALVIFLAVRPAERAGATWAGYVSAAAEAAMVGGLADWFAVTALFRRPLGLPIPHTALIPTRKDALGESLGSFVGENFLSAQVVRRRLEDADVVGRLARWVSRPENAERVTAEAANVVKGALEVLQDDDVRAVAEEAIRTRLATADVAPVLGRLLGKVVADGSHRALVEVAASRTAQWLRDNENTVITVIEQQAPEWSPTFVDRVLARRIHKELVRISANVAADPVHPLRLMLDRYLIGLAGDLEHDPETAVQLRALATRLFDHAATREAVGTLVGATRRAVVELIDEPDGQLRMRASAAVAGMGGRLSEDGPLRRKVDAWLAGVVEHVVTNYRDEITRTITDTVDRWDGNEAARRIELVAGRDLQFIRVNGSVVGALAGLAIYTISQLLH